MSEGPSGPGTTRSAKSSESLVGAAAGTADDPKSVAEKEHIPLIVLICDNCGFVRLHDEEKLHD